MEFIESHEVKFYKFHGPFVPDKEVMNFHPNFASQEFDGFHGPFTRTSTVLAPGFLL